MIGGEVVAGSESVRVSSSLVRSAVVTVLVEWWTYNAEQER